jgi:hypothetical protein
MGQLAAKDKVKRFLLVQPVKFRFIVRFAVEKTTKWDSTVCCAVEVILSSKVEPQGPQLRLNFFDVTELEVGDLNATVSCMLVVEDISSRGLEGAIYRVVDEESGYFSLNCRDFEFATPP